MSPAKPAYPSTDATKPLAVKDKQLEYGLIGKLPSLIFGGAHLSDLMVPLDLVWRAWAQARAISGLSAYE